MTPSLYEQTRARSAEIRAGSETLTAAQRAALDVLAAEYARALSHRDGAA